MNGTSLTWSRWPQAARLIVRGRTARVGIRVSLVVGTILSAANQGAQLVDASMTAASWVRIVVNYAVPYVVSSVGVLSAYRVAGTDEGVANAASR